VPAGLGPAFHLPRRKTCGDIRQEDLAATPLAVSRLRPRPAVALTLAGWWLPGCCSPGALLRPGPGRSGAGRSILANHATQIVLTVTAGLAPLGPVEPPSTG